MKAYFIYLLSISFLFTSCTHEDEFILKPFFEELKEKSPPSLLERFKTSEMDSVILNHKEYSKIYVDAAAEVFKDTAQVAVFENFIEEKNLIMQQDLLVIIAAFHKWLNEESIQFEKLRNETYAIIEKNALQNQN